MLFKNLLMFFFFTFFIKESKRARYSNGDGGAASPSDAEQVKVPTPEGAGGSTPEGFEPNAGDDPQTEDETIGTASSSSSSSSSSRFVLGAVLPCPSLFSCMDYRHEDK
jgi:hypothetical protein